MLRKSFRMTRLAAAGLVLCAIAAPAIQAQHKPKPKPAPTPSTPYKPLPKKTPSPCDKYWNDLLICASLTWLSCPKTKPPGC